MTYTLHNSDCLDVLRTMPESSVDSIITDPPYGLKFMGKKWDYDVPDVDVWAECLRVLKPGGHLLAFAGTRTQHRMAARIEDAGFEIRDMIAWVYGSGFPKSRDLWRVDIRAEVERQLRAKGVEGDIEWK
ncbi:DNA methyltransferase [Dickeya poaceiphila]|uniref:DNA methyltransferase n=2 Tax=Dickeya poaceiphila TaxID=568768 RepID=UPI0006ACC380|nr:DNA methyltransferase [Dickeya poaceiphila]